MYQIYMSVSEQTLLGRADWRPAAATGLAEQRAIAASADIWQNGSCLRSI